MFLFITLSWNIDKMPWRGQTLFLCSIFFCESVIIFFFWLYYLTGNILGPLFFLMHAHCFISRGTVSSPARAGPWHRNEAGEANWRSCWLICFPLLSRLFPLPLHGSFFHWLSSTCGAALAAASLKLRVILGRVLLLTILVRCSMAP